MLPTSIDPASGAIRIRLATPAGCFFSRSITAKNRGSAFPAICTTQAA